MYGACSAIVSLQHGLTPNFKPPSLPRMQQAGSRRQSEKPCICRSTCLLVRAHAEPGAMLAQDFSVLAAVNACAQLLLCGGSCAGSVSCAASRRCLQAASPEKATTLVRIEMTRRSQHSNAAAGAADRAEPESQFSRRFSGK